ncbi:hypothetical protein [Nonlabens sp.]
MESLYLWNGGAFLSRFRESDYCNNRWNNHTILDKGKNVIFFPR